jgi:hypothetical protein
MHILLRPVPVLSGTLERRLATFLFAVAKCTNINSAIPRQAPSAITGNKNGTTRHAYEYASPQPGAWQGTHTARGQVSGGGKKSYRRKGTGRARQGSLSAP